MALESVQSRFSRDMLQRRDDRKARGFDQQTAERKNRRYVDPATGVASWTLVPAVSVLPAITGSAVVGQTLTANDGTWTNSPTLSREWLRSGVVIAGATGTTYVLVAGDATHKISVRVTATKNGYPDAVAVSPETAVVAAA